MHIRPPRQTIQEAAAQALCQLGVGSVGVESQHLTVADFEALKDRAPSLEWKPGKDRVETLRLVKDAGEVEQICGAIQMAEQAFTSFRAALQPTDTEKDLADRMEGLLRKAGAKASSFPTIVAVGERAALPHAPPTVRPVSDGWPLLVDWGASGPFYKSDLTRVLLPRNNSAFPGQGKASPDAAKVQDAYRVVLRAQERARQALRPGIRAEEVDAAARAVIAEAGYGDRFTHSLGHGLGMMVHEGPMLRAGSEMLLQPGMVVTLEPGIYVPGQFGIRIEDDALVTPDGCQILTHLPREWEANRLDF
jgi:Xaa-Pro aminopeptidase